MENLPPQLITNILTRLTNSSDLTQCRLTSKTLNSLSYEVTSLRIFCSYNRYKNSRQNPSYTPFKTLVTRLVTRLGQLDSLSLGVDKSLLGLCFDDVEDEGNDLHLTDIGFVEEWLVFVKDRLKMLSFVDFWVQSCWRKSLLLSLISKNCKKLNELQVKNAWLSLEEVTQMHSLTSLTLEYIRLDDENLSTLNDCFPCLQTLNLIGVGELLDPKICLKHLKTCRWTVSNAPLSLTIVAPQLVQLQLKCVMPNSLILETPMLSDFHLTLEFTSIFVIKELPHLRKLKLESHYLRHLICSFPYSITVKELSLVSMSKFNLAVEEKPNLELLFDVFPNISSLSFGPTVYSDLEASFSIGKLCVGECLKFLKDFIAHLVINDVEVTLSFISFIVGSCNNLSTISLLIHRDLDPVDASGLISKCMSLCSRVIWKWGYWEEGKKDAWVSDVV